MREQFLDRKETCLFFRWPHNSINQILRCAQNENDGNDSCGQTAD
jgi:hypothetical protein